MGIILTPHNHYAAFKVTEDGKDIGYLPYATFKKYRDEIYLSEPEEKPFVDFNPGFMELLELRLKRERRQLFALPAMQAAIQSCFQNPTAFDPEAVAAWVVQVADATIAALDKK